MLTRRTLLKQGGCAALAVPLLIRTARAQAATFDYYISITGNDSNAGTLASPWSITALNSKRSIYAGKRVGIVAGIYNTNTLNQAASWNSPALGVNGGAAGSPTYVASCDASGNYSPRAATLTALSSAGVFPSVEAGIIGQGNSIPNKGNVTLDGLIITGSYEYGIVFYPSTGAGEGGASGITIENCEVYNITGYENDNVAGILLWQVTGAVVRNCKIHQCIPTSGNIGMQDCCGIMAFSSHGNIYEYNTIYNTTVCIYDKNGNNGGHTYRYNYLEQTSASGSTPLYALTDCTGGNPGDVHTVHHNIMIAPNMIWQSQDVNNYPSHESIVFYNNTCYYNGSWSTGGVILQAAGSAVSPAATITHYNNIYYCTGSPTYVGNMSLTAGTTALSDYNCYGNTGQVLGISSASSPGVPKAYTLAGFQAANGSDAHSINTAPSFVSPTSLNPTGYQLNPGSAGKGAGSVTGTSGGATCDMGAWGYDPALGTPPSRIGCDFGPLPKSPVLTVS